MRERTASSPLERGRRAGSGSSSLRAVARNLRVVVTACISMAILLVVAPPSAGAADAHSIKLVQVNSSDRTKVQLVFRYDGSAGDASKVAITENGKRVTADAPKSLSDAGRDNGVVFVVDTSASTDQDGALTEGKDAINAVLPLLPKGTQVALVAASSDALLVQRFTTDTALITKGLGTLTPLGDGGLWEGVSRAADEIKNQTNMVGSIVLVTDGNNGKGVSFSNAQGLALSAGASSFVIGVDDGKLGDDPRTLADSTGGAFAGTQHATDATDLLKGLAPQIAGLYTTTYASNQDKGISDITLTVSDASTKGSYIIGSDARGPRALAFQPQQDEGGIKSLQNALGKNLGIILAVVAAALAAYAIIGIFVRDQTGLASVLQPYSEGYVARSDNDEDDDGEATAIAQTAMMQRAVEFTRQFAERRGFLAWVEASLERANLPLRAAEAMFFYVVAALLFAVLTAVLTQSPFVVLIVVVLVAFLPIGVLNFLSNRRRHQFEAMLPDTLQLLSGTLRAGYSMMQGVEAVSQEVSEPMGRELRRVVTESRLGRPLEESLDSVAERMESPDFGWAVMAIRIQREVGGNLSELLMTVAETMTQRERLKRDVKSLTAEGRISAYVLAVLPVALGLAMYALNPDYMSALFDETIGKIMLGVGVVMMVAGFMWMQAIVKIDV